jgi:hypothetical protein
MSGSTIGAPFYRSIAKFCSALAAREEPSRNGSLDDPARKTLPREAGTQDTMKPVAAKSGKAHSHAAVQSPNRLLDRTCVAGASTA